VNWTLRRACSAARMGLTGTGKNHLDGVLAKRFSRGVLAQERAGSIVVGAADAVLRA